MTFNTLKLILYVINKLVKYYGPPRWRWEFRGFSGRHQTVKSVLIDPIADSNSPDSEPEGSFYQTPAENPHYPWDFLMIAQI